VKIIRGRSRVADAHDTGMSLIEVIVAIAIVSAIALSSASLAINGSSLASSQERKQVAVTIASGAMETASAQSVATIYSGRTKTAVQAAFAANSAVPGIAAVGGVAPTYQVWDTTIPVPSAVTIPITPAPISLNGTTCTGSVTSAPSPTRTTAGPTPSRTSSPTPTPSSAGGVPSDARIDAALTASAGYALRGRPDDHADAPPSR